jgi:hypothetical protein
MVPSNWRKRSLTAADAGGLFFPQRTAMGLDSRDMTPGLASTVVFLASEIRSFERAAVAIRRVLRQSISPSTVRRAAKDVGLELTEEALDGDDQEVVVPQAAVVSCDGGRIRTREPGNGRGVCPSGENGWRETKNASLERMMLPTSFGDDDPCPDLPTTFQTATKVAKITEKPAPNVAVPPGSEARRVVYQGPKRVLRTVLASMVSSDDFGPMMEREARRRRFFESSRRAFIGDGLPWNWTIWKKHFRSFVPILDFIHALHYVFDAAMCVADHEINGWKAYLRYVTLCWQGRVDDVIRELTTACRDRGIDLEAKPPDDDPNKPLADAVRYLTNNRSRMDYPTYRRLGLPVTSSPMESLVKQINLRVKGTEMFWDDPDGAEAILRLRAASLSDDGRLDRYLANRPGRPFVRRTTLTMAT